jgi:uracil-DNA glycosylase family 4
MMKMKIALNGVFTGWSKMVPGTGPKPAKLMIVGMAPEKYEVAQGKPFVGPSGGVLNRALQKLNVSRNDCFITNVSLTPLYEFGVSRLDQLPLDILKRELIRLANDILEVNPNVILALGDEPLNYLTGKKGITKWAGSILECSLAQRPSGDPYKVVSSVHPAWILRGMWKWLAVFEGIDLKRAVEESLSPSFNLPSLTEITGPSFSKAMDWIDYVAKNANMLSWDIETVYWTPEKPGHVACLGLAYKDSEALCIPFITNGGGPYWTEYEEIKIWNAIRFLLQSDIPKIGQNISFDIIYMWLHGIYPKNIWIDTMLAHHCLYSDFGGSVSFFGKSNFDEPGHSLAFLTRQYTRFPYYKDDSKFWSGTGQIKELWSYNCKDAAITLQIANALQTELTSINQSDFFQNFYMRPFFHALRMEWDGIKIDKELREKISQEITLRVTELNDLISDAVKFKLNVRSPQQLQKLLYDVWKLQIKKNRKTGKATVDKEVLEYYAIKTGNVTLKRIIEIRHLLDQKSDWIDQELDEQDRIHCHYKLGGTDGARWSSTKSILGNGTNLQNPPRDGFARRLLLPEPRQY